ncbi:MAG TPA: hypothetical protein VFE37_14270 [Chloroflexota bacterium]|nr:hypothetical protein [Chloroflexota bacterium]
MQAYQPSPGAVATPGPIAAAYAVYAHHMNTKNQMDAGQYMGVVHEVIAHAGVRYIHVRGGLQHANELFIPMTAVRLVIGKQVHLSLSPEQLVGRAWHIPPVGYLQ